MKHWSRRFLWLAFLGTVLAGLFGIAAISFLFPNHGSGEDHVSLRGPISHARRAPAAAKRFDAWRVLGPGGGGAEYTPTISPHDPNLVLVSCDMSGAYISEDGGASWRMFNLLGKVNFFAFDPLDSKVIYASSGRALWRSRDRGRSWSMVTPGPSAITSLMFVDDDAGTVFLTRLGASGLVTALTVDPENSNWIYATIDNQLCQSHDAGATWQALGKISGSGKLILVDPHSPRDNRTLYVVTWSTVCVLQNHAMQVLPAPDGTKWIYDTAGGFAAGDGKPVIYVITDPKFEGTTPIIHGGLLASRDGGQTWVHADRAIIEAIKDKWVLPGLRAVAADSKNPNIVYLSYSKFVSKDEPSTAYFGVAKSTDGGNSWSYVWKEAAKGAANVHDAWLTRAFGPYWGENPLALGVAPGRPEVVYGTDYGRTMRSTDGGATWQGVYSVTAPDGTAATTGLDVTTAYGVHFDPFDRGRIFISYTDIGMFASENSGDTWRSIQDGIPKSWRNTAYWMVFDPAVKGRAWAVMSGTHDLPRARMVRKLNPNTLKGGVVASEDGGLEWHVSNDGMPEMAATHIILDPRSPPNARVLYVTGFGRGVYKSADGGKHWTVKNNGLPESPRAWRLAEDANGTLYVVVARKSANGKYGNADDGALYRSADGAGSWQQVSLPEGLNGPNGITVDAQDPNRLYLAAWCRSDPVFGTPSSGGIFLSADGGKTWRNVFSKDQYVYDVTQDPQNPSLLYACGFQASAWRSTDRGESWTRIRGYNFKAGHRVIPDPGDPGKIYITTFGGSVWYGPAAGDPNAAEDITAPAVFSLMNGRKSRK